MSKFVLHTWLLILGFATVAIAENAVKVVLIIPEISNPRITFGVEKLKHSLEQVGY